MEKTDRYLFLWSFHWSSTWGLSLPLWTRIPRWLTDCPRSSCTPSCSEVWSEAVWAQLGLWACLCPFIHFIGSGTHLLDGAPYGWVALSLVQRISFPVTSALVSWSLRMSPWKSLESCHHFLNEETGAQRTRDLVFRWYLLNGNHCSAFPGGNQSHCSQPVREERVSGVLGAGWASSSPLEARTGAGLHHHDRTGDKPPCAFVSWGCI